MSHLLADVHAHDMVSILSVHLGESFVHLFLGTECLDDAQASQRFLHHAHGVAPKALSLSALCFELSSYESHEPSEAWHEEDGEEGELPTDDDEGGKVGDNQDRVLEEHVERRHDAVLHFLYITTHAGDDVAFALLAEETQREGGYLLIELVANITYDACSDRDDGCR